FQKRSAGSADQLKDWRNTRRMRRAKTREPYANDSGLWIGAILGNIQRAQLEGNCLTLRRCQRCLLDYDLTSFSIVCRPAGLRKVGRLSRRVGLGRDLLKHENQGRDEKHCGSRFHFLLTPPLDD